MRDDGWNYLLAEVDLFCGKHDIPMPNMEDVYVVLGRPQNKATSASREYRVFSGPKPPTVGSVFSAIFSFDLLLIKVFDVYE